MLHKTCIVIGGHGDIGSAVAKKFASHSYNVAVTYFNTYKKDLKREIESQNVEFYEQKCDITNLADVKKFIETVASKFSSVDCLVNCAGLACKEKLLIDVPECEIDSLISVNLKGVIYTCQEISKLFMQKRHGAIVNISSIYGISGGACESVYSACKGGIIALSKALASEVAGCGVRVNAVAPGCIDTKMTADILREERAELENIVPLGRIGTVEDVANVAYFLGSDESAYITGEVISVTGGVAKF